MVEKLFLILSRFQVSKKLSLNFFFLIREMSPISTPRKIDMQLIPGNLLMPPVRLEKEMSNQHPPTG